MASCLRELTARHEHRTPRAATQARKTLRWFAFLPKSSPLFLTMATALVACTPRSCNYPDSCGRLKRGASERRLSDTTCACLGLHGFRAEARMIFTTTNAMKKYHRKLKAIRESR